MLPQVNAPLRTSSPGPGLADANPAVIAARERLANEALPMPEVRAVQLPGGIELSMQGARGWVALHSRRDPRVEAARWLEGIFPGALPEALAIIGLGAGHVLDVIEARAPRMKVLAVEPLPALADGLRAGRDLSPWIDTGRLRVVTGPDYADAIEAREALGLESMPPVLVHPVLARELKAGVGAARMVVAGAFFGTPVDPRNSRVTRSMLPPQVLVLLEHLASTATGPILEIGPYMGGSTMAFCRGLKHAGRRLQLISVEGGGSHPSHPTLPTDDILADLRTNLSAAGVADMVEIVHGWSNETRVVDEVIRRLAGHPIGLLFIDANGEVQRDFDNYLHHCAPGGFVVVDDYAGGSDKNCPTREAVQRALAEGRLQETGMAGTGTWVGTVANPGMPAGRSGH